MTTTTATGRFIGTEEHRRFTEFADTVKREHTIGICYGPAGVGKTLSARRYAHWNKIGPYLDAWTSRDAVIHAELNRTRTLYYTPYSGTTPRRIRDDIHKSSRRIDEHLTPATTTIIHTSGHDYSELLIIDEAERLTASSLEMLRDEYDRHTHGLIFIGMPGIEKRFSRYPQLYSRVGFAHHYRPLTNTELTFVLTRHWRTLGLDLDTDDFTDTQAIAAVARLTAGNFRLIGRLFAQVKRIMKIGGVKVVGADKGFIYRDIVTNAQTTTVHARAKYLRKLLTGVAGAGTVSATATDTGSSNRTGDVTPATIPSVPLHQPDLDLGPADDRSDRRQSQGI